MKRLLLPLLLTGLLAHASPTLADSSASANIDWDSLNIQLFDLSNGTNAPAFNWTSASGDVNSYAVTYPDETAVYSDYAYDFTTLLSTSALTTLAQSDALRSATTLSANAASQAGTAPGASLYDNNYASASSNNWGNFSLTGHGIALITMNWSVSVTGAMGDWYDYGYASASISGSYTDGLYSSGYANSGYGNGSYYIGSASHNGSFTMAVVGTGGVTTGSIQAYASAYALSPSAPVPEAETYALMLAGLGMVGWMVRRRRA
jgi:hypothetical protein